MLEVGVRPLHLLCCVHAPMKQSTTFICLLLAVSSFAQGATTLDYGSANRTELSAGIAPRRLGEEPVPSVAMEDLPTVAVKLTAPTAVLTFRYQQRWYLRDPNLYGLTTPILLHRLFGTYSKALTLRLALNADVALTYGVLDYTSFATYALSSPTTTTTVPISGFIRTATEAAGLGFNYQATNRTTLGLRASGNRRQVFNQQITTFTLGNSQAFALTASLGYILSEKTTTNASLTISDSEVDPHPPIRNMGLLFGVTHRFSRTETGTLGGGVTAFAPRGQDASWAPVASASFNKLTGRDGRRVIWTASSGYTTLVDTISGRLLTVATTTGNVTAELGNRWTATATLYGSVPTTSKPIANGMAESAAQASLTFTRAIGNHAEFFTGIRQSWLMTHPKATPFEVLDRQTWVFSGFALWLATPDGTNGRWVL